MNINEYMESHKSFKVTRYGSFRNLTPRVVCADGFTMSVQVGDGAYCRPRANDAPYYAAMEVGYPNTADPFLSEFAEDSEALTDTVYGYVPVEIIDSVIKRHGGIVLQSSPPEPIA